MPIVGFLDFADWVLYDEVRLSPGGTARRQMFATPVGQADYVYAHSPDSFVCWHSFVKNYLHTNSHCPGMLDPPCSMKVTRLNVLFLTHRPLRIFETSAYRNVWIEFSVNRRTYWASPAWQCASPFALFDTPKDEIANLKERYGIAWESIGASFDAHPVEIHAGEYFTVRVDVIEPGIEEELACHVYLDGIEARASQ